MRYALGVVVLVAMVGCGGEPAPVDGAGRDGGTLGGDAALSDDASAGEDAPSDSGPEWVSCGNCRPGCSGTTPVCVTTPGTAHDCSACVPGCGTNSTPRDEPVSCNMFHTPVCAAVSEQATFCYRDARFD